MDIHWYTYTSTLHRLLCPCGLQMYPLSAYSHHCLQIRVESIMPSMAHTHGAGAFILTSWSTAVLRLQLPPPFPHHQVPANLYF